MLLRGVVAKVDVGGADPRSFLGHVQVHMVRVLTGNILVPGALGNPARVLGCTVAHSVPVRWGGAGASGSNPCLVSHLQRHRPWWRGGESEAGERATSLLTLKLHARLAAAIADEAPTK